VFAAVRDGLATRIDVVRKGYERVLSARLKDAKFFYEEDTNHNLRLMSPSLRELYSMKASGLFSRKLPVFVSLSEAIAEGWNIMKTQKLR